MTSERTSEDQAAANNIYDSYRDEIHKRQLSNTENYDKSILTLSSSGLVISLTFLNIMTPTGGIQHSWIIITSWILFILTIGLSLLAYLVSNSALDAQLEIAEDYYVNAQESAFNKKNFFANFNANLNKLVGVFFFLALIFTVVFLSINLSDKEKSKMSKSKEIQKCFVHTQDSAPVPTMQRVQNSAQVPTMQMMEKSARVPSMQAAPKTEVSTPKDKEQNPQNKSR